MRLSNEACVVIVTAAAIKISIFVLVNYFWSGDSGGYSVTWLTISSGHITQLDGGRLPLYPALIGMSQLLVGATAEAIPTYSAMRLLQFLQGAMGFASCMLVYGLLNSMTGSRKIAAVFSLLFVFAPEIDAQDIVILPQTSSTFLLLLTVFLYMKADMARRASALPSARYLYFVSGVVAAIAVMARPDNLIFMLIFFTVCFAAIALAGKSKPSSFTLASFSTLLPFAGLLPIVVAWMLVVYVSTGFFSVTTLQGWNQANAIANMFHRTTGEDALVGRIVDKHYSYVRSNNIAPDQPICMAWPELIENAARMPFEKKYPWTLAPEMSFYLLKVSRNLIMNDPVQWLQNSAKGFLTTFEFPAEMFSYVVATNSSGGTISTLLIGAAKMVGLVLSLGYALAIGYSIYSLIVFAFLVYNALFSDGAGDTLEDILPMAISVALLAIFMSFCLFSVYLPRFGTPYTGMIVVVVGHLFNWTYHFAIPRWASRRPAFREMDVAT